MPSLVEAQLNYIKHGTSDLKLRPRAQSLAGFERDENWRLIDLGIDNIELTSIGDQGRTYPEDWTTLYYWRDTYWRRQQGSKEDTLLQAGNQRRNADLLRSEKESEEDLKTP